MPAQLGVTALNPQLSQPSPTTLRPDSNHQPQRQVSCTRALLARLALGRRQGGRSSPARRLHEVYAVWAADWRRVWAGQGPHHSFSPQLPFRQVPGIPSPQARRHLPRPIPAWSGRLWVAGAAWRCRRRPYICCIRGAAAAAAATVTASWAPNPSSFPWPGIPPPAVRIEMRRTLIALLLLGIVVLAAATPARRLLADEDDPPPSGGDGDDPPPDESKQVAASEEEDPTADDPPPKDDPLPEEPQKDDAPPEDEPPKDEPPKDEDPPPEEPAKEDQDQATPPQDGPTVTLGAKSCNGQPAGCISKTVRTSLSPAHRCSRVLTRDCSEWRCAAFTELIYGIFSDAVHPV